MRFAEHMLLEANNYRLVPYARESRDGKRCALGLVEGNPRTAASQAQLVYPWIVSTLVVLPCQCDRAFCSIGDVEQGQPEKAIMVLVHLFNEHVMQGGAQKEYGISQCDCPPWTMEQLADWINSVDPTLPEPDPDKEEEELPVPVAAV